jgi:heme/copper-type cytochrome/quinol oxidase subunit 1
MAKTDYWLLALGAALVSCLIIAASHCWQFYPPWANEQFGKGWTIYPPLSAIPQAIPEQGVTMEQYYGYLGLLAGATVAAAVAVLFWLANMVASKSADKQPRAVVVTLLPLLLLVPCIIHLVGTKRANDQSQRAQLVLTDFLLRQELEDRTVDSLQAHSRGLVNDTLDDQ